MAHRSSLLLAMLMIGIISGIGLCSCSNGAGEINPERRQAIQLFQEQKKILHAYIDTLSHSTDSATLARCEPGLDAALEKAAYRHSPDADLLFTSAEQDTILMLTHQYLDLLNKRKNGRTEQPEQTTSQSEQNDKEDKSEAKSEDKPHKKSDEDSEKKVEKKSEKKSDLDSESKSEKKKAKKKKSSDKDSKTDKKSEKKSEKKSDKRKSDSKSKKKSKKKSGKD